MASVFAFTARRLATETARMGSAAPDCSLGMAAGLFADQTQLFHQATNFEATGHRALFAHHAHDAVTATRSVRPRPCTLLANSEPLPTLVGVDKPRVSFSRSSPHTQQRGVYLDCRAHAPANIGA